LEMAAAEPNRWLVVDALQPVADIQAIIRERVASLIKERGA